MMNRNQERKEKISGKKEQNQRKRKKAMGKN